MTDSSDRRETFNDSAAVAEARLSVLQAARKTITAENERRASELHKTALEKWGDDAQPENFYKKYVTWENRRQRFQASLDTLLDVFRTGGFTPSAVAELGHLYAREASYWETQLPFMPPETMAKENFLTRALVDTYRNYAQAAYGRVVHGPAGRDPENADLKRTCTEALETIISAPKLVTNEDLTAGDEDWEEELGEEPEYDYELEWSLLEHRLTREMERHRTPTLEEVEATEQDRQRRIAFLEALEP